jgi:hypothetical protein
MPGGRPSAPVISRAESGVERLTFYPCSERRSVATLHIGAEPQLDSPQPRGDRIKVSTVKALHVALNEVTAQQRTSHLPAVTSDSSFRR